MSHYEPKPLVIAEHSKFYRRTQNATETVLEYAAELRRLALTCDFSTFLNTALRNKFVFGLRSEPMRKSLLTEDGIDMAKAVALVQPLGALKTSKRPPRPRSDSCHVVQAATPPLVLRVVLGAERQTITSSSAG